MDREVRKIKQGLGLKFAELVYTGTLTLQLLSSPPSPRGTLLQSRLAHCHLLESPRKMQGEGGWREGRGRGSEEGTSGPALFTRCGGKCTGSPGCPAASAACDPHDGRRAREASCVMPMAAKCYPARAGYLALCGNTSHPRGLPKFPKRAAARN